MDTEYCSFCNDELYTIILFDDGSYHECIYGREEPEGGTRHLDCGNDDCPESVLYED